MDRKLTKILVIHPGALGDTILALPVLAALKATYDPATLCLIGHPLLIELLPGRSTVDTMKSIEGREYHELLQELGAMSSASRAFFQQFDVAVVWTADQDGYLHESLCRSGIPTVVVQSPRLGAESSRHATDRFKDTLGHLLGEERLPHTCLTPTGDDRKAAGVWLSGNGIRAGLPVVAVHPGSGSPAKCWPPEQFAAVVIGLMQGGFGRGVQQDGAPSRDSGFGRGVQQDGAPSRDRWFGRGVQQDGAPSRDSGFGRGVQQDGAPSRDRWFGRGVQPGVPGFAGGRAPSHDDGIQVLLIEGPADTRAVHAVQGRLPARLPRLYHASLSLVLGVLSRCSAFVGNDSGVTQMAAVLGLPTVAVFGPTDPAIWGFRCTSLLGLRGDSCSCPTREMQRACEKRQCLSIPPEIVLDALRERLHGVSLSLATDPSLC